MSRKKKNKLNNKLNITYQGKVRVSILDKKRVVSTSDYHNLGKLPMFVFLAKCLQGNYADAEPNRPKFIQAFSIDVPEDTPITDITDSDIELALQNGARTISKIIYMETPRTSFYTKGDTDPFDSSKTLDNDEATIKYGFLIPFTQIVDFDDINMFAIYNQSGYSDTSTPAAYFLLTKLDDNDEEVIKYLDINAADQDKDYSVLIEWTIVLSN